MSWSQVLNFTTCNLIAVELPPSLFLRPSTSVQALTKIIQCHFIRLLPPLPLLPPPPLSLPRCPSKIKTLLRRRRLSRLLAPQQQRSQFLLPLGNADASSARHTRHDRRLEKPRHAKDYGVQHTEWGSEREREG